MQLLMGGSTSCWAIGLNRRFGSVIRFPRISVLKRIATGSRAETDDFGFIGSVFGSNRDLRVPVWDLVDGVGLGLGRTGRNVPRLPFAAPPTAACLLRLRCPSAADRRSKLVRTRDRAAPLTARKRPLATSPRGLAARSRSRGASLSAHSRQSHRHGGPAVSWCDL